jgi:hypothetical protein
MYYFEIEWNKFTQIECHCSFNLYFLISMRKEKLVAFNFLSNSTKYLIVKHFQISFRVFNRT